MDREHVDAEGSLSLLVKLTFGVLSNPIVEIALSPVTKANISCSDNPLTDAGSYTQP